MMSDAEATAPLQRVIGTPYKPGQSGNPAGRPRGSRNRLADAFITDLRNEWNESGVAALRRCATEEPAIFVKIVATLLPRDVNLNLDVGLNAADFGQTFRAAVALLGNQPPPPRTIENKRSRK